MTLLRLDSRPLATSRPSNTQVRRVAENFEKQLTIRLDIIFAFAHLGMELKMRKTPIKSIVSDYYATIMTSGAVTQPRPRARVVSKIHPDLVGVIPRGEGLPLWKDMLQHLPITGRLFAHFPGEWPLRFEMVKGGADTSWVRFCDIGYYWEALQLMGTGDAHWDLH
jgi:hypothetical protein